MTRLTLVLTMLGLLLSGCETAVIDARACPMIKQYSRTQLAKMADELETAGPALAAMSVDYLKLRDQVRACRRGL
jgi:uncharacterized protein YceK